MKKIIAVLDACVLYPAPIRDYLLNLAAQKLFYPKWSEQIHQEWMDNLLSNRPDLNHQQLDRTRSLMDEAFPNAIVQNYEKIEQKVTLPDPEDEHVLAAAIESQSKFIVTFNLRDFPNEALGAYKLQAINPDDFISRLIKSNPEDAIKALNEQVANLKKPPMSKNEVLLVLESNGLKKSVQKLRYILSYEQ